MARKKFGPRQVGRVVLVTAAVLIGLPWLALLASETTSSDGGPETTSGGAILGILLLLSFAVALFVLFLRFIGPALPDTAASGRWVAWLRTVVDLGLALYVVLVAAIGVAYVVGQDGLQTGGDRLRVGGDGISMTFRTANLEAIGEPVPAAELAEREANAGRGFNADDARLGDVRERYGSDARLFGIEEVHIEVRDPTTPGWIAAILTLGLGAGTIIVGLYALRALLAKAARGEPFHPQTVLWLRVMAFAVLANVVGVAIGQAIVGHLITSSAGAREGVPFQMEVAWLGAAFILLALAEVWRYGVALQRDAEATV